MSRVHRAVKDKTTKASKVAASSHRRAKSNLAIGIEQSPLIILAATRGACDKRPQLAALGRSRAPVLDADADNNAGRKCLVLAQAM